MYENLTNNLQSVTQELEQFNQNYPDLRVTYIFPEDIVLERLSAYSRECSKQHIESISYLSNLERGELHGIDIGSFAPQHDRFKVQKTYEQLEKAQDRFEVDLKKLCDGYKAEMLSLALRISGVTASNTAQIIDARSTLVKKVARAEDALHNYYTEECTKYRIMSDKVVDMYYHTQTVPEVSGLYFLIFEGKIVYIGRSGNIYNRVNNHEAVRKYYLKSGGGGYNIVCGICEISDDVAGAVEKELIRVAQPEFNVQSKNL